MRRPPALGLLAAFCCAGAPGPAAAQGPAGPGEGRISVVGRAQAQVPPDFAAVEIGVETKGATPAAALDGSSATAAALLALAAAFGLGEADIGTTAVTLQPATRPVRQSDGTVAEKPDGYRAANIVRIRLADMARLGELMRRALDAGANRIEGVGFGLRDPEAAQAAMQAAAMRDARAQAARLAEAAGVSLGPVASIQSLPRGGTPLAMAAAPMRARRGGPPVPLAAGSIETGAEVAASFCIAP